MIPDLKQALVAGNQAVLVAAPGAGKTTRVPLALRFEEWLAGRKIVLLEPRRLAARAAARYMANMLGEQVGETVGYRVRGESRAGPFTRVEVVTEGVLTRMLQEDPALEGVGLVIFDEFHERHLQSDLGLALCLEAQAVLREDLRLLVMSATLEAEAVARLLGGAPIIRSEGRSYPVETRYLERKADAPLEAVVARTVLSALREHEGDVLVFLPGAAEIRRAERLLADELKRSGLHGVRIAPLYGALSREEQDRALRPGAFGERKVVLATDIAETSLTVEGVRIVIDSGLAKVPRFSPQTGMSRLETVRISRASADQRRGRAGRLAPGVCYRLWTEAEERLLPPFRTPELLEADLAPLALELALWGVQDAGALKWLDVPPAGALAQARELLATLGALDAEGAVTPYGRRLARISAHPRLAHMMLQAGTIGETALACQLAALLQERDILRQDSSERDADIRSRVEALNRWAAHRQAVAGVDDAACRRIREEAARYMRELGADAASPSSAVRCGLLLAFAYPDRIAARRPDGRYLLANGRGAELPGIQPLSSEPFLVAAVLDDRGQDGRILLAAPVTVEELQQVASDRFATETVACWNRETASVQAWKRIRLGAIVLKEAPWSDVPAEMVLEAMMEGIRSGGLSLLPWTKTSRQLRERIGFMRRHAGPEWPDVSDEALLANMEEWLGPHLYGRKSLQELKAEHLVAALESLLTWQQRAELDTLAPTHIRVPSGSRIPVDYADPDSPVLAVRLQELFGLAETPRIAGGRVPLTLHLLSPALRPVQITRDLASFWREAYFDVKKDLKGRYPKHVWPDDPLQAAPTSGAKPKRKS